jgi:hypothetical protein
MTAAIMEIATLFADDFSSPLNPDEWDYNHWQPGDSNPSFYGRTQQSQALPLVSGGLMHLKLDTYNPTNGPVPSFFGSEVITKELFSPESGGVVFEVQARLVNLAGGIVGGIFSYSSSSSVAHDEIDFEALSNLPDNIQTNIYHDEPLGAGHPRFHTISGDLSVDHTYRIEWFKDTILWYVDGQLIRQETGNIPQDPMALHLNIWAPGAEWSEAFNDALNPVASASLNTSYFFEIDSVHIGRLSTAYFYDTTPPTVVNFEPADNALLVPVEINIVVTFSEWIRKGTGTIQIHTGSASGPVVENFDAASSSRLTLSGVTLTIDPMENLSNDTHYCITLDAGAILDLAGNSYAGTTAYDFTTVHSTPSSGGTGGLQIAAGSLDSWEYIASYQDLISWVKTDGILNDRDSADAALHYNYTGILEGRTISFDAWKYLASNTDLMNRFGADGVTDSDAISAARQYIETGYSQNLPMNFDAAAYLAANPDLVQAFGATGYVAATKHYIATGRFEIADGLRIDHNGGTHAPGGTGGLQIAAGSLDSWEYIASYQDLISWVKTDGILNDRDSADAALHYNYTGILEGRTISFDAWKYLASNTDLMNRFGADGVTDSDAISAARQYIETGYSQNLPMNFDAAAYLAANPDLVQAFGATGYVAATKHYIATGRFEIADGLRIDHAGNDDQGPHLAVGLAGVPGTSADPGTEWFV